MRRAFDRTRVVEHIAHTRLDPGEDAEQSHPSTDIAIAAARSKRENAAWATAASIMGVLGPLAFVLIDIDYFVRVPVSAVVSGVFAILVYYVGQARWFMHPAAIVVSYLGHSHLHFMVGS